MVSSSNESSVQERSTRRIYKFIFACVATATLIAAICIRTPAQQTVFNVPTTDVLDKGKVYFELDVSAKPNDSAAVNKFSAFVPRLVWAPVTVSKPA